MTQQSLQIRPSARQIFHGKWKNYPKLQTGKWEDVNKLNPEKFKLNNNNFIRLKDSFLELDGALKDLPKDLVGFIEPNVFQHLERLSQQVTELLHCLLGIGELWMSKRRMQSVARTVIIASAACQSGKSKQLRYYNNSTQSPRASSVPQTLNFREQRWDPSGMPASIPQELWDMRHEENRFKSFHLPDASFASAHLVSVTELAADGFFYLQDSDKVKCAFCKGVLKDWEAGEQVREAHRRHFSTCPFVLFVEVGNVPREDRDASVRSTPVPCSEEASDGAVMVSGSWSCKLIPDAPPIEISALTAVAMSTDTISRSHREAYNVRDELMILDSTKRPGLPVSIETARSASSDKALMNLSALQHRFESESATETAKHPQFASFHSRITSLQTALVMQPDFLLAKAGFFCPSDQRVTCCFSCDLRVKFWSCEDDVWVEHARWSPRCPHVLVERGCDFVIAVHRMLPPMMPPVPPSAARPQHPASSVSRSGASSAAVTSAISTDAARNSKIDDALALTPGVEFRVEARDIKARADLPVVRLLSQLGFSALQIRLFTELHLRVSGDDFASSELFFHYMVSESRRMRELSLDPEAYFQARMAEIRRSLDQQPKCRDSIDWKTCKVCMDKEVNVVLLDCGHVACCSVCSKSLKTCPICRAFIKGTLMIKT